MMPSNAKKPAEKSSNRTAPRKNLKGGKRTNPTLIAWISIGVVVAIIATVVLVKTLGSSSATPHSGDGVQTSQTIYDQVTHIPASVYDTVGITSPAIAVTPPTVKTGQPPLTATVNGKTYPESFYWGAEFCPYCAATRWSIVAALSRFGTFDKLYNMYSSSTDYAPNTPTFSFYRTTYSSPYLVFKTFEVEGPVNNGVVLQKTPPKEQALVLKYNPNQDFPFLNIGNETFTIGSPWDPINLAGLSREEIASSLSDPTAVTTQAIVTLANYYSAGICSTTKGQPGSVCQSSGVQAAAKALKLTF
jgi:hypothetical protein